VHVSAKIYVTSTIPERCGFLRKGTYLLPPRKKHEFAGILGEVVSARLGKNIRNKHNARKIRLFKERHVLTTSPQNAGICRNSGGGGKYPSRQKYT
jgi:hypothetical protein